MLDVALSNRNEMLRYESDMDQFRALALWVAQQDPTLAVPGLPDAREQVFDAIKVYSHKFAVDIRDHTSIEPATLDLFHQSLGALNSVLGISEADIRQAGLQQRSCGSGFWEMRRVIGQLGDVAETAVNDGVTHIITAAVSGCVIGAYLGLQVADHDPTPVDHMVFARNGPDPIAGILSDQFQLRGDHILLVDDAVMATNTAQIMNNTLRTAFPDAAISLMAVDISPEVMNTEFMRQFVSVYTFDE
jgi:hypothetical protein